MFLAECFNNAEHGTVESDAEHALECVESHYLPLVLVKVEQAHVEVSKALVLSQVRNHRNRPGQQYKQDHADQQQCSDQVFVEAALNKSCNCTRQQLHKTYQSRVFGQNRIVQQNGGYFTNCALGQSLDCIQAQNGEQKEFVCENQFHACQVIQIFDFFFVFTGYLVNMFLKDEK